MAKIRNELIPLTYETCKKVYYKEISLKEGKEIISKDGQMNSGSAHDFLTTFKRLIEGKVFHRTMNYFSMNYFLTQIENDFGTNGLKKALLGLKEHITYYENLNNVNMKGMRELLNKFSSQPENISNNIEQDKLSIYLQKEKIDRQRIIDSLQSLKPTDSEKIIIKSKSYKRDNKTIAELKELRDYKCQICGISILKKDGRKYIEAAHIQPKYKKGPETPDNILILCPNHHKEFDYGDLEILTKNKQEIDFKLNGKLYKIDLQIK